LPNRQAVALRKCQLAKHKRAGPKTKNVSQCLQFADANMVVKKEEGKIEKREKGKDDRTLIRSNL
jgi:hypothetical protein